MVEGLAKVAAHGAHHVGVVVSLRRRYKGARRLRPPLELRYALGGMDADTSKAGQQRGRRLAEAAGRTIGPAPQPDRSLRAVPLADRPRERLERVGPAALANSELLGIVLGTGRHGASAVDLANELMAGRGLVGLARSTIGELCGVPGCGPAKAVRLLAALELGRRVGAEARGDSPQVNSPAEAAQLLQAEMALLEQEHLRVVLLSMKNHVLGVHEVYKGSVNASLVRVSEVFREAVRRNCPAIIVVHNHPSGDPAPSAEDIHITRQMVQAGHILDIELLDHIIIGRQRWVSLRERGLGFG